MSFLFIPFFFLRGFFGNLHPSCRILSLAPTKGLCLRQWLTPVKAESRYWTYTRSRDVVMFMDSSVTYICQGGILLLGPLTYTLSRDFVMFMASSVNYIRQGRILLLGLLTYTLSRDFVMFLASSVTYIRQGGILLLGLLTYTISRDFVMFMASSVTYIRQGEILSLSHFAAYTHYWVRQ